MDLNRLNIINRIMQEMVDKGFASGASTLVIKDGREIFYGEAGLIDIENGKPHRRDSILRLYSMSKPITAATAMAAIEDGFIDVNSPVKDYIPSFAGQTFEENGELKPVYRDAKVKDLLNMTAGLSYGGDYNINTRETSRLTAEGIERLDTDNEMTTLEFATRMGKIPLLFSPGEGFSYSYCADILGAVIEVATGKRFGEYMKERILDPLGMCDTGFYVPYEKRDRLAKVYAETRDGLKEYDYNNLLINLKMEHAPAFESGGAGLVSTLDDYAKFAAMLMNNGLYEGKRILNPGTVKYFTEADMEDGAPRNSMRYWDGRNGCAYANLLCILKNPGQSVTIGSEGEYGWDGWLGPFFLNDPKHKLTVLHMLQRTDSGTTSYMRRIKNVIFSIMED